MRDLSRLWDKRAAAVEDPVRPTDQVIAPIEGSGKIETPIYDRVPPTMPRKRGVGDRALESAIYQMLTPAVLPGGTLVGGGSPAAMMPGFLALIARIDNYTNQWIECVSLAIFIPPGNIGRILRLNGAQAVNFRFAQAPAVAAAAVVAANQIARIVLSNEDLPENPGFVVPVAVVT